MENYGQIYNLTAEQITAILSQPVPWENEPASVLGITMTIMGLSALCVLARLYIRLRIVRMPGLDDLFVGLYLITTSASTVSVALAPSFGMGQHVISVTPENFRILLIFLYVINASYVSSTALIKLSLVFQYIRIYHATDSIRRMLYLLVGLISLWGLGFSIMAWFPCFPVHRYWDLTPEGTCYGFGDPLSRSTFAIHTTINMLFDLVILAIPIPLCFEKSTMVKSRVGMIVLLTLGIVVNMFAAWRLAILVGAVGNPTAAFYDSTFYAPPPILLAALELGLASICASVPIFWPVLNRHLGKIFSTTEFEHFHGPRLALAESETELTLQDPAAGRKSGAFGKTLAGFKRHTGDDFEVVRVSQLASARGSVDHLGLRRGSEMAPERVAEVEEDKSRDSPDRKTWLNF